MIEDRFLRLPEVEGTVSLRRSEILRRVVEGAFPAPVRLGRRVTVWSHQEVLGWMAERRAERDSQRLTGAAVATALPTTGDVDVQATPKRKGKSK